MKLTLTQAEMLSRWRYARTAEPLRLDCTLTRIDGTDFDAMLCREMRAWYLRQLDEAPEEMLAPEEAAESARTSGLYGSTHVILPDNCRRILRLQFSGWDTPLRPDGDPALVRRLAANPYARPMAAAIAPNEVIVAGGHGSLASVTAILDPGEDTYIFDDRLLIPTNQ